MVVSNKFTASNGVKQGAILSPILLSVLFERLEKSGVGCHMGNHYTGSLGYADDLTMLAPTLSGLQVLIKICERYADEFDIKCNGAKSVYMFFGGRICKCDNRTVMVNGAELHSVDATVHLGHHISLTIPIVWFRLLLDTFGEVLICSWRILVRYIRTLSVICSSYIACSYYCAPLWCLQSNMVSKASRKIWRLSPRTHCDILPLLSDCVSLDISLKQRFMTFIQTAFNHTSPLIIK